MFYLLIAVAAILILSILYLLAIMPRILNRPDLSIFRQKLFAHRGLHDNRTEAPENSMNAFRKAVDAGYGIEFDVQLTKDQIPVVFHDFTLQRMCGVRGRISQHTYEELRKLHLMNTEEKIPSLQEVLELVDGKVPLIIELKIEFLDVSVCRAADRMLRNYSGKYCIESFNPWGLRWYRKHHPGIVRGQLSQIFGKHREKSNLHTDFALWTMGNLLFNFLTRPDFIAYDCSDYKAVSRRLCKKLYQNKSVAWTVRSEKQLQKMRKEFDVFIFENFTPEKE